MTRTELTARANYLADQAIEGHRIGVLTSSTAAAAADLCERALADWHRYEDAAEAGRLLDAAAELLEL